MTDHGERPDRDLVIEDHRRRRGRLEEFAGGELRSYRGFVNRWLLLVYAVLGVWGVYYLLRYWGGLGPGLQR